MTGILADIDAKQSRPAEGVWLFLRRWAANPLRVGSVVPSSRALCSKVVKQGWPDAGSVVVELGGGTGVVSQAFLDAGLAPERLVVVEVDADLCKHLRATLPGVTIIEGDARKLPELLPERFRGRIGSVVCGIPLVLLPEVEQKRIIDAVEVIAPGKGFVLFTYCATSPLPWRKHNLKAKREAWTPLNIPPASVWRYVPASITCAASS